VKNGILLIILSGLSFMIVNFLVKVLGGGQEIFGLEFQRYPAHELVLARSIVSFSISAYIIKKRRLPFFGLNRSWLFIRGASGTIALTIFFYTIHELPLAVASTVQYLSPIFTVILATFLVGEKVIRSQWFFIILSFSGVCLIALSKILVVSDQTTSISPFWLGLGVISSAFSGLAYNAIIRLKPTDEPITIVMYFPLIAIPIMSFVCLFEFTTPIGIEWFVLLAIGIFTQIAQILLTRALHADSTSVIMPFQYLGAIYAFLVGYFVFDEGLSLIVNLGIVAILAGVLGNVILRRKKAVNLVDESND
jgi:drug/metabolite transporter (DMT)-like permease